jgi:hypothetical protein
METIVLVLSFVAIFVIALTLWELVKKFANEMVCSTIGDSIYMIGGGVVGSASYKLVSENIFAFYPSAIGFSLIVLGALMRNHYSKKAK